MVTAMADTNSTKMKTLSLTEERRPLLKEVNHCLICILCGGYLIDATTIIECLHTYCRSCIVKFLQTSKFCPICDVQVHRTKPYLSLRYDETMQKLVYKSVPGLYKNELLRRKSYKTEAPEVNDIPNEEMIVADDYYFAPDEPISLSLEYIDNRIGGQVDRKIESSEITEKEQITFKRYLSCPARLKIRHIYKFIKVKYNLKRSQEVEISYDNNKLPGSFSLMDVAYTFSWKGETPMRLCYQILESKIIQVPQTVKDKMSDKSLPLKNNFVTNFVSHNGINNAVQNSNNFHVESDRSENTSTKVNLKRKSETAEIEITSNTDEPEITSKPEEKDDAKIRLPEILEPSIKISRIEPSVKIPRISSSTLKDIMEKKEIFEEKIKPTATVSPCTENGLKLPAKTTAAEDFNDDYIKYEQDIEEVEDDDDDDEDDDRLRISEEDVQDDKGEDNSDQQLVIDISDFENVKDERKDDENEEVGKKSTKYKRKSKKSKHSHHHKHHRHHERKKQAPPEATILHSPDTDIMKLKLKLNNVKPDAKYHKQRRKRKKSSECYFSSSFSSSSSVSSASGMSPDAHNTRADEDSLHSHTSELSAESIETPPPKDESPTKTAKVDSPVEKYRPPNKEKLLQMRAFRPKNIAVVKPEENHKLEKPTDKPKNDNNNNDSTAVVETKEKPKASTPALRPPSSITVSKITAAEKQKMEKEKLMMMNGNKGDKPSLEIMLVNGPPSSGSFTSPVSSTTDVTSKPKTPPRQIRPPPAAIPLVHYHKMKSNEQNIPKSLTITPQIQRSKSNEAKTVKDTLSIRDSAKRTVTVSLSGNPFENDFTGALDLSGKTPKYADMINVAQSLLNKKPCLNNVRSSSSMRSSNGLPNYSSGKCLSTHTNNIPFRKSSTPEIKKYPISPSPKSRSVVPSPQSSPKMVPSRTLNPKINKPNVPKLNEIKIGPVSSSTDTPLKPGPNQTVRQIPNPSIMLERHKATVNSMSAMNGNDYLSINLPKSTSIMNHRIAPNVCSFSTLKAKNDKCPPAIPLKGYMDISSIMATK